MTTKRKPYVRPMTSTVKTAVLSLLYAAREGTIRAVPAVWFSIEPIFGLFALKTRRARAESSMGFVGFTKPGGSDSKPDSPRRAAATKTLLNP